MAKSGLSRIASRYSSTGPVELPLAYKATPRLSWGPGVVGLEPDRLAVFVDGLVEPPETLQGDAEVGVGLAKSGLSRIASRNANLCGRVVVLQVGEEGNPGCCGSPRREA